MTLGDLYNALDWTELDKTHEMCKKFSEIHNPEFIKAFRCVLIHEALYSTEPRIQASARFWLKPIWNQVVSVMDKAGLLKKE